MDNYLDEWELLPREEELFIHSQNQSISNLSNTKSVIDMNYFQNLIDNKSVKHCLDAKEETCKEVFAAKMEENKFVDIEMDCPMSENKGSTDQVDDVVSVCDDLEEKDDDLDEEEEEVMKKEEDGNNKNNVWKWAMSRIAGAVFSFGFVATSVSLVALGKRSCSKDHRSFNTSEIHFQIYTHDKRMKRVVKRTKRLNEAIAAVRGAPYMTRAHITIGGYYEGL